MEVVNLFNLISKWNLFTHLRNFKIIRKKFEVTIYIAKTLTTCFSIYFMKSYVSHYQAYLQENVKLLKNTTFSKCRYKKVNT